MMRKCQILRGWSWTHLECAGVMDKLVDVSRHMACVVGMSSASGVAKFSTVRTNSNQKRLPSQPVPSLADTAKKFVDFAVTVQTPEEYKQTQKVADAFLKSAAPLQLLLEQRAKQLPNWLTPWWLNHAYLEARTPLPIVTSPGVTFPPFNFVGRKGQMENAAKLIQAALTYHHHILEGKLPEDRAGSAPLDMSQYKLLFGTTRIPQHGKDRIQYGKDLPKWADHILVTRNGHAFHVPVYNSNGDMLTLRQLETQLEKVIALSNSPNPHPINVVSSDYRETWATVYERVNRNNQEEMRSYESALFVLCLDTPLQPQYESALAPADVNMGQALHGGGTTQNTRNRWFDKTLQFYINESGYGGLTYEHTPAEGPPLAMLLDFICDQLATDSFSTSSPHPSALIEEPSLLQFTLGDKDLGAIKAAGERINNAASDLEIHSLVFDYFGKNIPKAARLSPDSFIQLAFQLAFYRLHRSHPPTYETGTLRMFHEGRTDVVRLPNMESALFVELLCDSSTRDASVTKLAELLASAVHKHKDYSLLVMNGCGMDRHLLGLKLIAMESALPVPDLYTSAAYKRLMHFQVSTSQVPTRAILPMGFGPSAPDCYGVCYNPQEQRIFFTITAFNSCADTSAVKFALELERALLEMHDIANRAGLIVPKSKL